MLIAFQWPATSRVLTPVTLEVHLTSKRAPRHGLRPSDWIVGLRRAWSRWRSPFSTFLGDWDGARAATTGFDDPEVLDRVLSASLAVHAGRAVYERDSVVFESNQYAWPVLAGLLWSATRSRGELRVLDLGGSLGTSYRQNRNFVKHLSAVTWAIVEQPNFVEQGKRFFENGILTFYDEIQDAALQTPNVLLVSGTLQYLDHPYDTLASLTATGAEALIIDRTPVHDGPDDRIVVQSVPSSIYRATFPAWIFSRTRLFDSLTSLGWRILETFETLERDTVTRDGFDFTWIGLICFREGTHVATDG